MRKEAGSDFPIWWIYLSAFGKGGTDRDAFGVEVGTRAGDSSQSQGEFSDKLRIASLLLMSRALSLSTVISLSS